MLRVLGVAGLVLAVCLIGPPRAHAADTGLLRLAHLSPDSPAVDVSVDPASGPGATGTLTGVAYGTVSEYRTVPAGTYTVSMRRAGAPADSPPVLSTTVQVPPGGARTVAGVGHFADLGLRVLDDDLAPPPAGRARVRIVAAAAAAPTVDVALPGGQAVAHGLTFGRAGAYVDVPAGATTLTVVPEGAAADPLPVDVAAGSVYSLLVLDRPGGGVTVRPVLDAAGTGVVPQGAVPAGEGGTAGPGRPGSTGVALAVLAAAGLLLAVRRPGRRGAAVVVAAAGVAVLLAPPCAEPTAPVPAAMQRAAMPPAPLRVPAVLEAAAGSATAAPTSVAIPSAGIETALVPLSVDSAGTLDPPSDTAIAGWFAQGPAPGAVGPAVLTGHVDSWEGPGAFFRLAEVATGADVLVTRADGSTARFTVVRVDRYPKDAFPTAQVYGPTPGPELRLITCGGPFDRTARSYEQNVVVYARLAG